MGIINVTPDSFSDGGRFLNPQNALNMAKQMVTDGVDILDIGGESTRPGSDDVSETEEKNRVIPVIKLIRDAGISIPVSIDTRKLSVAEEAFRAGANIVNDISALRDNPELGHFIAQHNLGLALMHMQGHPKTMQQNPYYLDVIAEIGDFFEERLEFAASCGINPENIVLDPGIGFGKTLEHNLRILNELNVWLELKRPLLVGPSRKSFIGKILDLEPQNRLAGTIGACVAGLFRGARIFRVHDVAPVREALTVAYAVLNESSNLTLRET